MSAPQPAHDAGNPDGTGLPALDTASLALEVRRLADRLRSLPQSRLQVRLEPAPSLPPVLLRAAAPAATGDPLVETAPPNRASLAHAAAQHLADAAAGVAGRAGAAPPYRRAVPVLSVFAVGDQVAVTGTDLAAALRGLDPATQVWTAAGLRGTAGEALAAALEAVRAVRGLA